MSAFPVRKLLTGPFISDDGRGFEWDRIAANDNGHYGLSMMRERAEELGGRLDVSSSATGGTTITAVVPTTVVAGEQLLAEL